MSSTFASSIQRYLATALLVAVAFLGLSLCNEAQAASAAKINSRSNETLADFQSKVEGGTAILNKAKGVLVMPAIYQGGIGIGGKYGEGALRVGGQTVDYYNLVGVSAGFQLGGQKKSMIMAFMEDKALQDFRSSEGYELGVDASAALITVGADGRLNTTELSNKPVLIFVFDQKGLMYNLSLAGSKLTKIKK